MSDERANLLIISDLHLGEDLRPGLGAGSLKHMVRLERELESFLTHYTHTRRGERPWRLIINGDMVDFLGVCLLPSQEEINAEAVRTPDEHVWGLGTHPRAARVKMHAVLARHERVFRALAGFVAAGNSLDIVIGNHDAEFNWPVVQETFRDGIAGLTPADALRTRDQVSSAICFHPWFYFEENVAWVEHGHQYDAYCSFDYVLHPAADMPSGPVKKDEPAPAPEPELAWNAASALLHYVTNHSGYVEGQEHWKFLDYLRWGVSLGRRGLMRLAHGFFSSGARLIGGWRRLRSPENLERRRVAHRARLKELADQFALGEDTLLAVDALRREPVWQNLGKLLGALMLDRLLLFAVSAVLAMGFVLALPWSWAAGSVVGTVLFATVVARRLASVRETTDPTETMRRATVAIRRQVKARYVVFGHTHAPLAMPLDDGGMYLNTGTWVGHDHDARGALAFTHVMIRHEAEGPCAALCEWRDGDSREVPRKA